MSHFHVLQFFCVKLMLTLNDRSFKTDFYQRKRKINRCEFPIHNQNLYLYPFHYKIQLTHIMNSDRRKFIKNSALATAAISTFPTIMNACASPGEKVGVGLVGCRSMGFSNLKSFLRKENNVDCVALCDVDSNILESRAAEVEKMTEKKPVLYSDFREMLDSPEVDAVIIGTPDHWHAYIMMAALEAGKHVYVEKPMGHSIEECYAMVKAASKYPNQVVQVGMWQRSSKHWFEASEIVKSGQLGNVHLVKAWIYKGYDKPYPAMPDGEAPAYVDYDMWLGPAPERPFNPNRFHYNHRWWWDYAGGAMTDWGVHLLDFAMFAMDAGMPEKISPGGGIYYHEEGAIETPDIQQALYSYPTHAMVWECGLNPGIGPYGKGHGVAFVGEKGTMVLDRGGWEIMPDRSDAKKGPFFEGKKQENYGDGLDQHVENFLECIRKGGTPNASVEIGAKTAIVSEMGNIAYRTGQIINWDDKDKRFKEEAADKLTRLTYREQWKLPIM
ncbi:gfo/Idh/MocA family oxidoreductase [Mariniphaga sediminis]|uniref:Gfo/Idh/MocA family oxidoreductase n=2 Tax=Mariniphaga sediminis TaxID=1628158 RepID=A0A399CUB8_9BACT|nr:gfo/Idh/MocA family oxidoreductase [Mariniphaga sediminis]